jgi:hypothetical protein
MTTTNKISMLVFVAAMVFSNSAVPGQAQSVSPKTVGDGTLFVLSPGRSEGYGASSGNIGGDVGEPLYSRHHRMGQSTGIGGSSLQTTTATSESTPAANSSFVPASSGLGLSRPELASPFLGGNVNPALNGFTLSPSGGALAGSGLTSAYSESPSLFGSQSPGLFQDLNAVPSFVERHSRMTLPLSGGGGSDDMFKNVEPKF